MKPNILYKYKPWNEFTERIITHSEVYCAPPERLNDPFDCKAEIFSSQFKEDIHMQMMQIHISSFVMFYLSSTSRFTTESERNNIKKDFFKLKGNVKGIFDYVQNYLKRRAPIGPNLTTGDEMIEAFESKSKNLGVFSLTEISNHMLMWAHYADQHKGIAIGFERNSKNDLGNDDKCRTVDYVNDFPKADIKEMKQKMSFGLGGDSIEKTIDLDLDYPLIKRAFFQKAKCWEYEKEWRLLDSDNGVRKLPGKIFEIVFGAYCPDETIDVVRKLVKNHVDNHVKFFRIKTKKNSFDLQLERMK